MTAATPWYRDRALLAVLAGSLLVRLVLALLADRNAPVLDEGAYLQLARGLATGGGYEGTFRPPLYPAFMAASLVLGAGTLGIRLAQAILGTVATLLTWRLADRMAGRTTALAAALIVACDPTLIGFSHRLWSETVFIVLLLGAVDLIAHPLERQRPIRWAAAGLLFGLATLTRPMIVTFLPFLLAWTAWQVWADGQAVGRTDGRSVGPWVAAGVRYALLVAACLVVVLPWTWRNYQTTNAVILVDSNGPFNILVGSEAQAAFVDKDDLWSAAFGRIGGEAYQDLVARDAAHAQDLAMERALVNIGEAPLRFAAKSWWEAGHLWTMDSFLLRHLRNGWYGGGVPRLATPLVTLFSAGFFVFLVIGALAGLVVTPPSPLRGLTLMLLLHSTALFAVTYALSRYSVPLHPLLGIFAAVAIAGRQRLGVLLRQAPPRRILAAGAVLVLLLSAWVRDMPLMKDLLLHGGSHHRYTYLPLADERSPEAP